MNVATQIMQPPARQPPAQPLPELRPEQALLVYLARTEVSPAARASARALLEGGDLEWTEVVRQARAHKVSPFVHRHVQALFPKLVPPAVQEQLRALSRARLYRSLLLRRTLPKLLALLERQGVRAVPFKGPVLAARAYPGREGLRAFSDLDLLVRPEDVWRAAAALERAGFEATDPLPAHCARWPQHFSWPQYFSWRKLLSQRDVQDYANGYVLEKDTRGEVPVELHWGLTPCYFRFLMDPRALRKRLVPVTLEKGLEVPALSPEDTLLLLCAHAVKHRWEALRLLCDIAELIRSHPALDWGWTFEEARRLRSERMLLVGVHLAETLLAAPVPPSAWDHAQARRPEDVAALCRTACFLLFGRAGPGAKTIGSRLKETAQTVRFHVRVRDRPRDGLGAGLHHLWLVNAPVARDRAWIDLPEPLSFLYLFVRPLRILSETLHKAFSTTNPARPSRTATLNNQP